MYQHGTIFSKQYNFHLHGLDMRDGYTNSIIKVYIWFYNVYILIVNHLYMLKYKWHKISKR